MPSGSSQSGQCSQCVGVVATVLSVTTFVHLNDIRCVFRSICMQVPHECPGVPSKMLLPETQWDDENDFVDNICKLGVMFNENFLKFSNAGGPGMMPQVRACAAQKRSLLLTDLLMRSYILTCHPVPCLQFVLQGWGCRTDRRRISLRGNANVRNWWTKLCRRRPSWRT
jgi:hypothetical protein